MALYGTQPPTDYDQLLNPNIIESSEKNLQFFQDNNMTTPALKFNISLFPKYVIIVEKYK